MGGDAENGKLQDPAEERDGGTDLAVIGDVPRLMIDGEVIGDAREQ